MLGMGVWKDDNAVFFKFTHINEPAGFFGTGIFGQGPYRFSVTPYWLIYQLVGYQHVWAYYLLILIFYFLITYLVYKVFSKIISPVVGRVASFLFAAGFIASEGFFWLSNAMLADVSMVIDLVALLCYFLYFRRKKLIYYFLAIALYWLVSFLVPLRNYYFIAVILVFELIYAGFKKMPRSLGLSAIRLIPFGVIFYEYFLAHLDTRAFSIKDFLISVMGGNWYLTQGFLSSVASLMVPDWFIFWLHDHVSQQLILPGALLVIFAVFHQLFKNRKRGSVITLIFVLASIFWIIVSRNFFSTPVLVFTPARLFIIRLGGLIAILALALLLSLDKKLKKHFLFFSFWFVVSVAGYTFYEPTAYLGTTHRYFAHSLVPLVGVLAILFVAAKSKKSFWSNLTRGVIIFWGITNLVSSVVYQNKILATRSIPVRNFYSQLKGHLEEIKVGDVFYFDVAKQMGPYFGDAFKVSSMPNETAIAWRWGVDRNDIRLFDSFNDFALWIEDHKLEEKQIHTYFYSESGLTDTSRQTWEYLTGKSDFEKVEVTTEESGDLVITPSKPFTSVVPVELELEVTAKPQTPDKLSFPYVGDVNLRSNKVAADPLLRLFAFEYRKQKEILMAKARVTTNSAWFGDIAGHLIDGNTKSVWRSHRVLWSQEKATSLTLDLGASVEIDRFVWLNAYADKSPTKYILELSLDGKVWQQIGSRDEERRIEPGSMEVMSFNPQKARYVRMTILSSLNNDSPGVAEVWAVPASFADLDIKEAENFLVQPFGYVPDQQSYIFTLGKVGHVGRADIYWQDNQRLEWVSSFDSRLELVYDSSPHLYRVYVPARGNKIEKIRISNITIPGKIEVSSVKYRHLPLGEILAR